MIVPTLYKHLFQKASFFKNAYSFYRMNVLKALLFILWNLGIIRVLKNDTGGEKTCVEDMYSTRIKSRRK